MKHLKLKWITTALLVLAICTTQAATSHDAKSSVLRLSEPVNQTENYEEFGTELDTSLPEVSLTALLAEPQSYLENAFTLETEVVKVCQKKGCFFIAREGSQAVRVAFKNYSFFVPTDSANKKVLLNGQLKRVVRSNDQAAHFSQDLGPDSPALATGETVEIVASAVRIPR